MVSANRKALHSYRIFSMLIFVTEHVMPISVQHNEKENSNNFGYIFP